MRHVSVIAMIMILLSPSVLWTQENWRSPPKKQKDSFGLGYGIPYGILGLNLDINVTPTIPIPNLNLSGGAGRV